MITAKDVSKIIDDHDPRIDIYIKEILIPKFVDSGRHIQVSTRTALDYFNNEITSKRFQDQLRKRGFFIKEECDDRPGGDCWVEIQVPPQGE